MSYSLLLWVPISLYTIAAWPQILTNYRRKDASGLSHWMLFLRLTAISTYTLYVYLLDLPLAHKVLYPLCLASMTLLAIQGYQYSRNRSELRLLRFAYGKLLVMLGVLVFIGSAYPVKAGMLAGWCAVVCGLWSDMPQIYRNWRRKSTQGFNILFASAIGFGGITDLTLSLLFGLPLPTVLATTRVTVCYLIYVMQFLLYGNRMPQNS